MQYINNYNWKGIKFPTGENIHKSDYNHKPQHIVDLLMITHNQNNWHYLTIKNMKRLIRGVAPNHHGDLFCRNCMHSYHTENALKKHERLCTNHDYCKIIMPKPSKNILESKSNDKSLHIPHTIYTDLEVILEKIQSCQPNLENSYTENKNVHIEKSNHYHIGNEEFIYDKENEEYCEYCFCKRSLSLHR